MIWFSNPTALETTLMARLKLGHIPDDKPVRLTIALPWAFSPRA
jgi:hypothetical protein